MVAGPSLHRDLNVLMVPEDIEEAVIDQETEKGKIRASGTCFYRSGRDRGDFFAISGRIIVK